MTKHMRCVAVGAGVLTLSLGVLFSPYGRAGNGKEIKANVLKIAEAIKKGNKDAATKQAGDFAKKLDHDDLEEVMEVFKKRDMSGVGVGSKPGAIVPDGIEAKLVLIGRDAPTPASVKKESEALEEMAYVIAAVAEVAGAKGSPKGKAKDWSEWSSEMRAGAGKLADAAKSKSGAEIKTAASKINAACNSCHSKYRK